MRNVKKQSTRLISAILVVLMLTALIPAGTVFVNAVSNYYFKYTVDATTLRYADSFEKAWSEAQISENGVVGTLTDVNLSSTMSTEEGRKLTLELNGHKLNRNHLSSSDKDCNAITVAKNSTLTVYGGTQASPKPTCSNSFTYYSGSSSTTTGSVSNMGLITGGRNTHNGGGIAIEESATCNLYYTAVSGNRADDAATTIGGYGGGIALRGNYSKLNMYNSAVSRNYAEVGGGICVVDSDYAKITTEKTDIIYNTATKQGGGIAVVDSDECKIKGDGDSDETNTRNSRIEGNSASQVGGGIYLEQDKSVIDGFDIDYNTSSSDGGGIYIENETCAVKNCNIYNNTASGKGGGIYNNDDYNTLEKIRIVNNKATGAGDGVYNTGTVNIALSGKCIIKNNDTQNLYLDHTGGQNTYIDNSVSKGSEVYITYGDDHVAQLTKSPGSYDDSFFYSDKSGYYFKWFPRDSTGGHNDRHIYRVSGTKPSKVSPTVVNSRTTLTSYTYQNQPVIRGICEFPASIDDTIDREAAFYYSDGYFKDNAQIYNNHLASLSINMAMASMYSSIGGVGSDSAEYRDKSNNIRQMMSDIGCKDEDIYVNDNNVKRPTDKTIGVCISSKDLPDGEKLVIIGVRGANYEAEWASNVSIGSAGEANGFRDAANTVFSELQGYLSRKGINGADSKTKFWIAGFSRAGATSNLTAKRIVDAYDTSGKRTFAYPIEAPKGALKSEATIANAKGKYHCIHNVLNFCDLVPWVAPGGMGFARYGVDHFVPGATDTGETYNGTPYSTPYGTIADNALWNVGDSNYQAQKAKMLKQLSAMNDDVVYDDYFHMATIDYIYGAVTDNFINESNKNHSGSTNMSVEEWIPKFWSAFQGWAFDYDGDASTTSGSDKDKQVVVENGSKIRTNYSTTKISGSKSFQTALAYVMNMLFSMEPDRKQQLMSCFDGIIDRIGTTNLINIYGNFIQKSSFASMIGSSDFNATVEGIWNALTTLSTEDEAKGYHSLTEFLSESELNELHSAFPALLYPILEFVSKDYNGYNQDHAGTLAYNAMRLIQNHYPEVAASWIRSYDSYYDNDTNPVTLKEGAGGKEKPHYPAVEVKSIKTGKVTTYDNPGNVIDVDARDEIRIVPNNSSYKNTGEAIYYRYPEAGSEACRGWHGFSDPIVFKNLSINDYSDAGSDGNLFTIDTFSAHYDMAANGTKTSGMNSAFDSTKRTYVFDVDRPYESGKYYDALQNVKITGNMRTDIVNIAKSQKGYMEGDNVHQLDGTIGGGENYTEYGRWYGLQDMWCAMFVSWCANKAGVATSVIPKTASTVTALNFFKNKGVAYTRASVAAGTYKPSAGDIIFFKSDRNTAATNHVGIVTSYSGTTINTIEGNTSSATVSTNGGCVLNKSYSITNTYIVYVCSPKYPSDTSIISNDNVEFNNAKYDYRFWPNADTRWGDKTFGSGSNTVGASSGISTAVTKLAIQAGIKAASEFNVGDFVDAMNSHNGYTAAGAMYWDVAKTQAGFDTVNANLMAESDSGVSFSSEKQQIINWLLDGYHLALYVADSKGVKSWVAVDEALTLSTGEIYIMDAGSNISSNADVKVEDKYVNLRRVAGFTGGHTAYESIGSEDYRIWRKYDSRWKTTKLGGGHDVYESGDLVIASTKLAVQAGLKNSQLYDVNSAIDDIKKGSNGGFSDAGNMYWADAAQALGFSGYNANLKASGTYSSSDSYSEIVSNINAGNHMLILVEDSTHNNKEIWTAVDEARTLNSGHIWVWRSNVDAESGGEKTGDNMYMLETLNSNFKRVACFTGGKTKNIEDHFVYLPGSFNGWKQNREMTLRSDGKCEKTIYLPKGDYQFKILADGYWYGNNGNIVNTNISDGDGNGWEFKGAEDNCTLSVTYDDGGYFTFLFIPDGEYYPRYLKVGYSPDPPQEGEVGPIINTDAEDYRKWNITDSRWSNASLNETGTAVISNAVAGYGDLCVAGAKMMIAAGVATPDTIDPGKLAAKTSAKNTSGLFDWDNFAAASGLKKEDKALIPSGTYETRLGGKTSESTGKTLKQYILENHYHLFIKIDDFSGGYGWALVDEAMTASATGGEIYVWLSKSTNSKSTDDNPVLLSSISTTFKQVAAYSGGNNLVKAVFSGSNGADVSASYSYNESSVEINSGDYIPYGSVVTVTGKPATGYEYDGWTHNLGSGDSSPTATSTSLRYTATASASIVYKTKSKNGTINYSEANHFTYTSKPASAEKGASVSFTINPDSDYIATVFVEKANGDAVSVTNSSNTYTFTMPAGDVNVSVEMNYDDYRKWSKSDSRWANTVLGTSSNKVKGTTVGMGDLVVAVTKLAKQAGSDVSDVNEAVSRLNAGGGLGSTGYLDWLGTLNSNLGFNKRNVYNSNGSSTDKADEIVSGINEGKHYVIKVNNSIGWVAVDETLTLLTGEIYIMSSGDNADENADVRLADLSLTFVNYAHFTGGSTPSPEKHTITFSGSSHVGVTASYVVGNNSYEISSGDKINYGMTVRFRASAEPSYEFGDWSCSVTPDQQDAAELVVTVKDDIMVTCTEKAKDSQDTYVPLRIKYCYKDYDPSIANNYEYHEGEKYLCERTVFSKNEYKIPASDLENHIVLCQKVLAGIPKLNSDYFNFYCSDISLNTDLSSAVEYDYTVDAYVVSVNMQSSLRQYSVKVNNSESAYYHFQQEVTLNASDYNLSDAVWLDNNIVVAVGDLYKFRVTGDINLTVRAKTNEDPDSLGENSIIIPAYETVTTVDGVEKCNQNFYIRNYLNDNDSSKTLIGAGVFYFMYDDTSGKPVKSLIKDSTIENLKNYALGFKNKKTCKGSKHVYSNKETGLAYSYISYAQDSTLNNNEHILRSPKDSEYVHYILELSIDNQPSNADKYSYHVYSFFLYEKDGAVFAVVSNNFASAKVFSAS